MLTDWLSGLFDDLAGIKGEGPLTFGHLKDADIEGKEPEEPGITLKTLTTNLNHKEPYVFPREMRTPSCSKKRIWSVSSPKTSSGTCATTLRKRE